MTPLVTVTNATGQDLSIRSDVLAGIRQASLSTGVEFSYLMAQANRESSFDPSAQAKTSSAAVLYQFVEQTWLGVVKNHGAEYGQGDLANQITRRSDGHYTVADPALRKEILELRRDPTFAAAMAGEHAADNKAKLEEKLGRPVNGTDLYMAHFLGLSGALKFLRTMEDSSDRTGASLFPKAAAANRNVFYTENGRHARVLLGGERGVVITMQAGDVLVIPAGVAHKCIESSRDFACVGAYPNAAEPDVRRGHGDERPQADEAIKKVRVPDADPVEGRRGPLVSVWAHARSA